MREVKSTFGAARHDFTNFERMRREASDAERRAVGEDAARWLFDLAEGGSGRRAEFVAWLKESPRHVEEFLFATATLREVRAGKPADSAEEIERLIAEALASPADSNVIRLDAGGKESGSHAPHQRRTRWWIGGLVAGLAAMAAGFFALPHLPFLNGHTCTTSVGEQRTVRLTDGSVVYLNARSRINVDYSAAGRDVRLLDGEAIFKVESDPARPFRVHTDSAVIQAVGTQFNVYRRPEGTTVSVLEGKVRVTGSGARAGGDESTARGADVDIDPAAIIKPAVFNLSAGEQARISADGAIEKPAEPDVAQVIAWRERRLVFRAERLENIAAEFSRYSPQHIRPLDETARNQRITGTFDADDPESLVLFLEKLEELEVVRNGNGFMVRARPGS